VSDKRVILTGGAGLVGQNLVQRLIAQGYKDIIVLDKHAKNLQTLKNIYPSVKSHLVDLAELGQWEQYFSGASVVVMLHAQIGDLSIEPFIRNNITATKNILDIIQKHHIEKTIHISSSVVNSVADDFYTQTKKEQELIVKNSGIQCTILRPTLMFGWFDRKHLGWLSRFMQKIPIFPIPGHGKYMRQPLYVGDFCNIILKCIDKDFAGNAYNISGLEKVTYIDIIRAIKRATKSSCLIINIPYSLFYIALKCWAVFDKTPPFTADQLTALVAGDEFEIIEWEKIFEIKATPWESAMEETFNHPQYSSVILDF